MAYDFPRGWGREGGGVGTAPTYYLANFSRKLHITIQLCLSDTSFIFKVPEICTKQKKQTLSTKWFNIANCVVGASNILKATYNLLNNSCEKKPTRRVLVIELTKHWQGLSDDDSAHGFWLKTRKSSSSCLTARGMPTAAWHHLLSCLGGGGYPVSCLGDTPCPVLVAVLPIPSSTWNKTLDKTSGGTRGPPHPPQERPETRDWDYPSPWKGHMAIGGFRDWDTNPPSHAQTDSCKNITFLHDKRTVKSTVSVITIS